MELTPKRLVAATLSPTASGPEPLRSGLPVSTVAYTDIANMNVSSASMTTPWAPTM